MPELRRAIPRRRKRCTLSVYPLLSQSPDTSHCVLVAGHFGGSKGPTAGPTSLSANPISAPSLPGGIEKQKSGTSQTTQPSAVRFSIVAVNALLVALLFLVGVREQNLNLHVPGFFLGSFISVLLAAVFLVDDNKRRSGSYRNWRRLSPRDTIPLIVAFSLVMGLANGFICSLEISRHLVQ